MRYTLFLGLADLPFWARATVWSCLSEYNVKLDVTRAGDLYVSARDEDTCRRACTAALQRIGKTTDDFVIDLFSLERDNERA